MADVRSQDLISNLPDDTLSHILSYLSTREAVSTSLLSKRWRYLFALLPLALEFDDFFIWPIQAGGYMQRFMAFVYGVMGHRRNLAITKFSLNCVFSYDPPRVQRFLIDVLRHGVMDLELCGCLAVSEVFISQTLVKLSLSIFDTIFIDLPQSVSLPMLKTLVIERITFNCVDGYDLEYLLSSCPKLEEFCLGNISSSYSRGESLLVSNQVVDIARRGNLSIKKFSLGSNYPDHRHSSRLIIDVLRHCVTDLELSGLPHYIASEVFMNQTLVKLKLAKFDIRRVYLTQCVSLPRLKTLALEEVRFYEEHGTEIQDLLSGCPVLEELIIENMQLPYLRGSVVLSSSVLQRLTLVNDYSPSIYFGFSLDTPLLTHLVYSGLPAPKYPTINLDSLVDAKLDLDMFKGYPFSITSETYSDNSSSSELTGSIPRTQIINGMGNVKFLDLSASSLEVIYEYTDRLPVFYNLSRLSFQSDEEHGWQSVPLLLKNSPILESLSIRGLVHKITHKCGDVCVCIQRDDILSCLLTCPVKELEIYEYRGSDRELDQMRHFLGTLSCLGKVKVNAIVNEAYMLQAEEAIQRLWRFSSNCDIQVIRSIRKSCYL